MQTDLNQARNSKSRNIVKSRISSGVVDYLVKDISNGLYRGENDFPSEKELMEEFGVGRSSIREAMSMLERMGLIEIKAGQRAKVRRPTIKPLLGEIKETLQVYMQTEEGYKELVEFRVFFECMIVRNLCRKITDKQLEWLKNSLQKQKENLNNRAVFAELDLQFHCFLGECLGNSIIENFAESVSEWLLDQRTQSLKVENQTEIAFKGHVALYQALVAHDEDKAEKLMKEHLLAVQKAYEKIVNFKG